MTHAERIRNLSSPLEPLPTNEQPQLGPLEGIESVVFDIYGTLIISGSGDIGLIDESNRETAMREAFEAVGATMPTDASTRFYELIREDREASQVEHPEVEIREIWQKLAGDEIDIEALAIEYECRTNVVWPMPNLVESLASLRDRGLRLGSVSNAQFYTPHLFEAFCNAPLDQLGFDPEIQVFSFDLREGKPSTQLYAEIAKNQNPKQALFVGNDMLKDIWPAQTVGFKTALFAGDQRSLRKRDDDARVAETCPDLVITDLSQLPVALA
ncbi:MAG: HAD family hydrolase [Verrucomicrobiota bacterium]